MNSMTPQEVGQLWEGFKHSNYAYYIYMYTPHASPHYTWGNKLSPLYLFSFDHCAGNFTDFWTVNKKLMRTIRGDRSPFRYIPFCVYKVSRSVITYLLIDVDSTR